MDHPSSQGSTTITPTELDRLGGKTHLLAELGAPDSSDCGTSDSVTMTGIPHDHFPDINVDTMHPTIAHDMRSFDMGAPTFSNFFDFPATHHSQSAVPEIQVPDHNFYPEANFHPYQPQLPPPPLTQSQNHSHSHGQGNGHTHMFDQSPPILDSTWQSFVEQLGF